MTEQALAKFNNFKKMTMVKPDGSENWELVGKIANLLPADIKKEDFTNALMHAMEKSMQANTNIPLDVAVLLARDCGKLGIVPDNKQAAIVNFKGNWQLMIMIGGVYAIGQKCGVVSWTTRVVHENDHFDFGTDRTGKDYLEWKLCTGDRGKRKGAFSSVNMGKDADGNDLMFYEFMTDADLCKIEASAPKSPAWNQWKDEMCRKSVAKRHAKTLPFENGRRMQQAIDHDNETMGFENAKDITPKGETRESADTDDQQASIIGGAGTGAGTGQGGGNQASQPQTLSGESEVVGDDGLTDTERAAQQAAFDEVAAGERDQGGGGGDAGDASPTPPPPNSQQTGGQ